MNCSEADLLSQAVVVIIIIIASPAYTLPAHTGPLVSAMSVGGCSQNAAQAQPCSSRALAAQIVQGRTSHQAF